MSYRANTAQQISINDRMNNLTKREQKCIANTWAKTFAEIIFPMINEEKFKVLYCEDNGRPNTPVNIVVGALFLKEMGHLTDDELNESIMFDIRYQYALHLTSYEEIPFSDRTLSRFRERLYEHGTETETDILREEIERLSGEFAKMMKLHSGMRRMDSVMVASSCKSMGRLELIYTCVSNLVEAIIKSGESSSLPERMLEYAEPSNKNAYCYRLEQEEVTTRLEAVTNDAMELYRICSLLQGGELEYQQLERMITDQTENGKLKANKQISPESMQNPSDEDATFRRKAGKSHHGYVGNFVETCGENGNIITQYGYDANVHSDTAFAAEVIEQFGKQDEPTILISDGAYASEANTNAAEENNIKFVTTNMTGQKPPEIVLEFEISENKIQSCPAGHVPYDCAYDEKKAEYRAYFNKADCESCPRKEECLVKIQKKRGAVKLSTSTIKRAEYTKKLSTEEYKDYARKRNGVEGIPSVLRRRYRVDEMPVRGLLRTKMWFGFKIGAINIKRVIKFILFNLIFLKNPLFSFDTILF